MCSEHLKRRRNAPSTAAADAMVADPSVPLGDPTFTVDSLCRLLESHLRFRWDHSPRLFAACASAARSSSAGRLSAHFRGALTVQAGIGKVAWWAGVNTHTREFGAVAHAVLSVDIVREARTRRQRAHAAA